MSNKEELMKKEKTAELTDESLKQVSGGISLRSQPTDLVAEAASEPRTVDLSKELENLAQKGSIPQSIEERIKEALGLNDQEVIKWLAEQNNLPEEIRNKML